MTKQYSLRYKFSKSLFLKIYLPASVFKQDATDECKRQVWTRKSLDVRYVARQFVFNAERHGMAIVYHVNEHLIGKLVNN